MMRRGPSIIAALPLYLLSAWLAPAIADPETDGERGIAEYRQGNLITAIRLLESSARAGYVPAQVTLAYIFDQAEENRTALHWYRQAARRGDAEAMFALSEMYARGEGTDANPLEAGRLLRRAAELGHLRAMRAYAFVLEHGELGFSRHDNGALDWYRRAAEHGDPVAMRRLRDAHRDGELGLPIDAVAAAAWDDAMKSGTR